MSDITNKDIIDACSVIVTQGNLLPEEKKLLENCIISSNPEQFLEDNCENPVFISIFTKLAEIFLKKKK